jgi:hypothetical protein
MKNNFNEQIEATLRENCHKFLQDINPGTLTLSTILETETKKLQKNEKLSKLPK